MPLGLKNHIKEDFLESHKKLMVKLCLISSVLFIAWAFLNSVLEDTHFEIWPIRIGISIYFLLIGILGIRKKDLKLETLEWLFCLGAFCAVTYAFAISWIHGFHPAWVAGTLLIIVGGLNFLSFRGTQLFFSAAVLILGFTSLTNQNAFSIMSASSVFTSYITALVVGLFSSVQRNRFLQHVLKTESQQSQILKAMSEAILVCDSFGRVIAFNPAAMAILGLNGKQLLDKSLVELPIGFIREDGRDFESSELPFAIAKTNGQEVFNMTVGVKKLSGEITWVSANAVPIFRSFESDLEHILLTFRDITKLKVAMEKINEQKASLFNTSKLSALGEMSAGIAHEINNPLMIIFMQGELIKRRLKQAKFTKENFESAIDKIIETSERIAKIVKSMRSLSRQNENDQLVPVQVGAIYQDIKQISLGGLSELEIDLQFVGNSETSIHARPGEFAQVLLNLINNSRDAILKLEKKWIKVEVKETDNSAVEISVTDSGSGIPVESRAKIMEPFYTTKEVGKGTGLGLSLVRTIVKNHNGEFALDTSSPHTRFIITLPKVADESQKTA